MVVILCKKVVLVDIVIVTNQI